MEDAVTTARELPAQAAEGLMTAAEEAYTSGLNTIGLACAAITATSAIIALTMLRNRREPTPSGQDAPREGAAEDFLPTA